MAQSAAGRYSDGFLRAIDKALAVRPEDRTASIAELRSDLGLSPAGAAEATRSGGPARAGPQPAAPAARVGHGSGQGALIGGVLVRSRRRDRALPGSTKPATRMPHRPLPAAVIRRRRRCRPPPPARSFEIGNEFERDRRADARLQASPRADRSRLASAGQARLQRDSSRDGYVQVLVLGPDGSLLLLFPNAQASDNRIKAGRTLHLPQPSWLLDTVEPSGREEFLVVVSAQPRDYSELSQQRDYIFLKLPTGKRGAEAAAGWTRSTPLLLGSLKSCPQADCEAYGAARFSVEVVR